MRVLLVAPFNTSKYSGPLFYFFGRRLANGFIRNGHFVVGFSDRDSVRNALGVRAIGARLANGRLIEIAARVRPHLLCLHTFDLITPETVLRIKHMVPECRVAAVYCDALLDPARAAQFRTALESADFGFATTAGPTLAALAGACPVAFIPNPVDISVDEGQAFVEQDKDADVFCCCNDTGPTDRWALIDKLRALKPNFAYSLHGRGKQNQLLGARYLDAMKRAKVGLNVNQFEGDLYASDRMAQYLGNGLLLATYRRSGFGRYFDDEEMIFFDDALDLGEKIERVISDDSLWRRMAERGYRKALSVMNGVDVTDFIAKMTLGLDPPKNWTFADEIYAGPDFQSNETVAHLDQTRPRGLVPV
jgi:hypothetical protein